MDGRSVVSMVFFNFCRVLYVNRVQHPGNRNLKCQFCDRTFNTLPDLDEHHRRHTGEGWVKCPVCDREFLTKDR